MYKISVFGDNDVGKSACSCQFIQETFNDGYDPTIEKIFGGSLKIKQEIIEFEIFDTSGQDNYKCLRDFYIKLSDGFYFVFDLTNENSLKVLEGYIEQIQRNFDIEIFPCVLIGNKSELINERKISKRQIEAFQEKFFKIDYFEVSAKENKNIKESFQKLIELIHHHERIKKNSKKNSNKKFCKIL